jgi:ankyrin repeat protein
VLLDAGADVNAISRNEMQVQPLHSAAARGDVETCEILLANGANPSGAQHGGWTPLDAAVAQGNEPLAALLRASGATLSGNQLPT